MSSSQNKPAAHWSLPFFTIWIGQALSLVGSQAGAFALVWWLTKRTGSGTVLATSTMAAVLPGIILGPFIGALVDRWNRRWVMILADGITALFSAWLAYLFWANALQIWHVYLIGFVRALGNAFHQPAMQASTSLMVPNGHLARVAGMNQTLRGLLNIVAPPLGAFLMSILPLYWVMGIDVITAAFAIVPLFFIHIPQPRRVAAPEGRKGRPSLWEDVREGFVYIRRWRGVFLLLLMATLINFMIYPAMSLLPLMVLEHFHGEALHLGWITSTWGIGVIAGGLLLSVWGGFRRRVVTSMLGTIGMGVGFVVAGLTPPTAFWLALVATFLAGTMNSITNGPVYALIQGLVAPEMQGRVLMIIGSMAGLAAPLGLAVAGPVADALGPTSWAIVGGATCILTGLSGFFIPAILHIEDQPLVANVAPALGEAGPEAQDPLTN
jgi:DHA3 family macrolide efflux protein-like MFS transporter